VLEGKVSFSKVRLRYHVKRNDIVGMR